GECGSTTTSLHRKCLSAQVYRGVSLLVACGCGAGTLREEIMNLVLIAFVWFQATAQISGTVKDPSGAVLPGVEVMATQIETGISRETVTNARGEYALIY